MKAQKSIKSFVKRNKRLTSSQKKFLESKNENSNFHNAIEILNYHQIFNNSNPCIMDIGFGDGKLLISIAKEKKHNNIVVPSGHPPRAMFGYTFPQLFYILHHYEIISSGFKADFKKAILMLSSEKNNIKDLALNLAKNLYKKTPVIYAANGFEGVSIRFRQQINENSKMLCWHHVVPEMNHNELLGWRTNVENLAVVYIRNKSDYERNQIRIGINKKIIKKYTANITEVWSEGESLIENSLYHINLGDWVSWYLSEMNNVDAIEIDVINFLKNELAKV